MGDDDEDVREISPIEPGLLLMPAAVHRMRVPHLSLLKNYEYVVVIREG